jgi:preprotein translocase subunit SecD
MNLSLRLQFAFIVVLTVFATWMAFRVKPGIDLAGGAELRYKVLFDPSFTGGREKACREATDVIRRRVESLSLKEPKITTRGDDEIVIQLPGVDADVLRDFKRVIQTTGKLELFVSASQELQERFERDGVVPAGYQALRKGVPSPLLVETPAVIEGRNIIAAEPHREAGLDGASWGTLFELDAEGARRFDEAAERLYRRSPRGRIAIVLDDVVRSAPVVNSPAFHGRGQISGAIGERK